MWPHIFDEFHDMQPLQPEKHVTKRRSYFATQLSRRAFLACLCCRSSKQKALAGGRTPEDLRIEHKDLIRGTLPASAHAVYAARSRHASVPVHSNAQFRSFDCDRVRKSTQDHNFIRQSTSRCLGGPSKRSCQHHQAETREVAVRRNQEPARGAFKSDGSYILVDAKHPQIFVLVFCGDGRGRSGVRGL